MELNNKENLLTELKNSLNEVDNLQAAIEIKNLWIKKHVVSLQMQLKNASIEEKKNIGKFVNELKTECDVLFENKKNEIEAKQFKLIDVDLSLENFVLDSHNLHWLNEVLSLACEWFNKMNFRIEEGNEIVTQEENFDLLNIGLNHPARLNSDSFYYDETWMLRAHNTSHTAKVLKEAKVKGPMRVATFGSVYRNDPDDATHTHQFNQIDFLWIQENLSLSNLKWVINSFLNHVFEQKLNTRYRMSFFPFTEPSFEVDVQCPSCAGKRCSVCKKTGWIEVLGSGMLHNNVLKNTGYDYTKFRALAAGIGVERLAMIKHLISDIRHFYNNDVRFVKKD